MSVEVSMFYTNGKAFNEANELYDMGKYEKAMKLYSENSFYISRFKQAECLNKLGKHKEEISILISIVNFFENAYSGNHNSLYNEKYYKKTLYSLGCAYLLYSSTGRKKDTTRLNLLQKSLLTLKRAESVYNESDEECHGVDFDIFNVRIKMVYLIDSMEDKDGK